MTALALAHSEPANLAASFGLPKTGPEPRSVTREEAIGKQVQLDRLTDAKWPSPSSDSAPEQVDKTKRAFFPAPEFRALPAEAEQVFAASKEWEGFVQSVGTSHFTAELVEVKSAGDSSSDLAEIPIGDIPNKDRDLLKEGAVFRYLVGYAKNKGGVVTRKRHVYFRRGKSRQQPNLEADWLAIAAVFRDGDDARFGG